MTTRIFLHVAIGAGAIMAQAVPPKPNPVPPELLSGSTLRLPSAGGFSLIDAPGPDWEWTFLGDTYFCGQRDARGGGYTRVLQLVRVARVPSWIEAQRELQASISSRERAIGVRAAIVSWTVGTFPVAGTVHYTLSYHIGEFDRLYDGYYTPQLIHLRGSAYPGVESELFRKFVESYRIEVAP